MRVREEDNCTMARDDNLFCAYSALYRVIGCIFSVVALPRSAVFTGIQVGLQTGKNHFIYINKTLAKICPCGRG